MARDYTLPLIALICMLALTGAVWLGYYAIEPVTITECVLGPHYNSNACKVDE